MAVYEYRALNNRGKEMGGIIEAESRISAGQILKRMDLYPVGISETTEKTIAKKRHDVSLSLFLDRINKSDISVFSTQFAALVEAGMPVVESFGIVIQQTEKKSVKKMLSVLKEEVNKGVSLADAFKLFPRQFSPLYINMVRAGEESGSLEIVLMRLADFLQNQMEMRSRIMATLAYPILMLIVGITVVFFLVTFVIPTVTGIFEEMNHALPLPTMVLLAISGFFKKTWVYLAFILCALILFYRRYRLTPGGKAKIDKLKLKLPIYGVQYKKIVMTRFTRTLGTLLTNGVPIVASFDIIKNIIDNKIISTEIEKAREDIKEGKEISGPLGRSGIFPPVVVNMIAVGEKSGQLEEMLNRVSRIMEAELDSSLKKLISLLEPVMILFMGAIVAFIVISILLPIFEMNQLIK
ncbi:MAG: type II secretion system F family protein [Thermodesulfobacteriota bacterium]|nr:type II secretion system F family protein [Thermodesulfobacteriota bacterium]